jgi:hypothetical protein
MLGPDFFPDTVLEPTALLRRRSSTRRKACAKKRFSSAKVPATCFQSDAAGAAGAAAPDFAP